MEEAGQGGHTKLENRTPLFSVRDWALQRLESGSPQKMGRASLDTRLRTQGEPREGGRVQGGPRTRDGVLRVELERVVHEGGHDGGRGLARGVGGQQRVVAIVDVSGLVEAQAPMSHSLIGCRLHRLHELGEDEAGLVEHGAIEEPAKRGGRLPVHREGDAPVMLLHCRVQLHAGRDCGPETVPVRSQGVQLQGTQHDLTRAGTGGGGRELTVNLK